MSYLDKDKLLEAIGEEPEVWDEWTDDYALGLRNQWRADRKAVESVPPADVMSTDVVKRFMADFLQAVEEDGYVKVVRCKDCKYSIPFRDIESGVIMFDCKIFGRWDLAEDFYCADGERREDVRND